MDATGAVEILLFIVFDICHIMSYILIAKKQLLKKGLGQTNNSEGDFNEK